MNTYKMCPVVSITLYCLKKIESTDTDNSEISLSRSKSSPQPPAGLLRPLPVPSHPWLHIAVDFVTGLPPSNGNTTILTAVDHFSKSVHYVPLSKLPSASQIAYLLVIHVFQIHGTPQYIVSGSGHPSFP